MIGSQFSGEYVAPLSEVRLLTLSDFDGFKAGMDLMDIHKRLGPPDNSAFVDGPTASFYVEVYYLVDGQTIGVRMQGSCIISITLSDIANDGYEILSEISEDSCED